MYTGPVVGVRGQSESSASHTARSPGPAPVGPPPPPSDGTHHVDRVPYTRVTPWDCDTCTRCSSAEASECGTCRTPRPGGLGTGAGAGAGAGAGSSTTALAPVGTPATLPAIPFAELSEQSARDHGSFGLVSRAIWHGQKVAVKESRDGGADVSAIDNEIKLYTLLFRRPHPHILTVHGVCTDCPDGKQRLVLEWCGEGSLEAYLRKSVSSVSGLHHLLVYHSRKHWLGPKSSLSCFEWR
jgi:hypothetical protein